MARPSIAPYARRLADARCGGGGGARRCLTWETLPRLVAALACLALLARSSIFSPRILSALFTAADGRTAAAARFAEERCVAAAISAGPHARAPSGPACLAPPRGDGAAAASTAATFTAAAGAPLHVFLRVAAGDRSHSGGARYLGLRKAALALVRTPLAPPPLPLVLFLSGNATR